MKIALTKWGKEYDEGGFKMNIGVIGAGAIAQFVAQQLQHDDTYTMTDVLVRNVDKHRDFAEAYNVTLHTDVTTFLNSSIDIVVEAATIEAVRQFLPSIVEKKPVVVISVGAFADVTFYERMTELLEQHGQRLYLPSGAIGGLDLLQNAAALQGIERVSLTTTKPAASLTSEPLHERRIIFQGTAREAVAQFPKNMNVSIMLALSAMSFRAIDVMLIADPHATQNTHDIHMTGTFGEASLTIKNNPLPTNPKTSYLAAMSIIGTLRRMQHHIIIA